MAAVSILGFDVVRGKIKFGIRGTWLAELELESTDTPLAPLPANLEIGGDQFIGTIIEAAGDDGKRVTVTAVGGQGGLRAEVSPLGYWQTTVGILLTDALAFGGEQLALDADGDILNLPVERFTRLTGTVAETIRAIVKVAEGLGGITAERLCWRVDFTGSVWVGRQIFLPFDIDYDVIQESPHERTFTIAVEHASALPGRIIKLHDVTDVVYMVDSTELRAVCSYGEDEEIPAVEQDLDRVIRARIAPLDLYAPVAYTALAQNADGTFELKSSDPRFPDLSHVPQRVGLPGTTVAKVQTPCAVIVLHENGDAQKPVVAGYEVKAGMGLEMTHTGDVKITAPKISAGGEEDLVKYQPLQVAWAALKAACAAHTPPINVPDLIGANTTILKGG